MDIQDVQNYQRGNIMEKQRLSHDIVRLHASMDDLDRHTRRLEGTEILGTEILSDQLRYVFRIGELYKKLIAEFISCMGNNSGATYSCMIQSYYFTYSDSKIKIKRV